MTQVENAFGDFLRARRARLKPGQAGLPEGLRRRTPGLRRDEVATLAGISVEWYVKLEQGRAVSPSAATIDALARALHLSPAEKTHLERLARSERRQPFQRETVPGGLADFVRSLDQPAWILGLRWDLLAWNEAASDLFGAMLDGSGEPPNLLLSMMTDPRARTLFGEGWRDEARRMLALFRATHDVWADDPAFTDLITRIRNGCTEFDAWWREHDVRAPGAGRKMLRHPDQGELQFEHFSFQSNDDSRIRLNVLTPL